MPGYFCVRGVNVRCGSARAVTAVSSTAGRVVPASPAGSRAARPHGVISTAGTVATVTPSASGATGNDADKAPGERK